MQKTENNIEAELKKMEPNQKNYTKNIALNKN